VIPVHRHQLFLAPTSGWQRRLLQVIVQVLGPSPGGVGGLAQSCRGVMVAKKKTPPPPGALNKPDLTGPPPGSIRGVRVNATLVTPLRLAPPAAPASPPRRPPSGPGPVACRSPAAAPGHRPLPPRRRGRGAPGVRVSAHVDEERCSRTVASTKACFCGIFVGEYFFAWLFVGLVGVCGLTCAIQLRLFCRT